VRVLLFVGSLGTGGAEGQFAMLADGLVRAGVDAELVTMFPGGVNWDRFAAVHPDRLSSLEGSAPRGAVAGAARHAAAPGRLREHIRHFAPDVVYSALYMSDALAWVGTRGGPPVVWSMRASDAALGVKRAIPFHFCRLTSPTVPLVIANAEAGRRYHVARGFRPRRFEVIPNGIDTERFRPDEAAREITRAAWGIPASCRVIGVVSRVVPGKGHDLLVAAARRVVDLRGDVVFVVVGDGPKSLGARLRTLTAHLGLEGRVRWIGHRSDVASVYPAFDLFCSPSISEGFPNAVAEAMACDVGCVVTDVGDSARIVGDTGQVVPSRDAGALAEAIVAGLDALPAAAGARRRRVAEHFSVSRMVDGTLELLSTVAGEQAATPRGARR
jgi:glycosyltransferase involved in cell wall biosynthesis